MEPERRLAAIMFTEIVGHTAKTDLLRRIGFPEG